MRPREEPPPPDAWSGDGAGGPAGPPSRFQNIVARNAPEDGMLSLSLVEKYLLKSGYLVRDYHDQASGRIMTRAWRPFTAEFVYPKPVYDYDDGGRGWVLKRLLEEMAEVFGRDLPSMAREVARGALAPPPDFSCQACGQCCERLGDAFRGRLSREEVDAWRRRGLDELLRHVRVEERSGYRLYKAWVDPATGRYLDSCPWLRKDEESGRSLCGIHAVKPLKCRAFPLSRVQAEHAGCPGFERIGERRPEDDDHPRRPQRPGRKAA